MNFFPFDSSVVFSDLYTKNPQFLLVLNEKGDTAITLQKQGTDGLIFFVYKVSEPSRLLVTQGLKPEQQSKYVLASSVSATCTTLEAGVPYIILCCT